MSILSIIAVVALIGIPLAAVFVSLRSYALIRKGSLKRWIWMATSLAGLSLGLALSFVWYTPDDAHRIMGVPFPITIWEQISTGGWIPFPGFYLLPLNLLFGFAILHLVLLLLKGLAAKKI